MSRRDPESTSGPVDGAPPLPERPPSDEGRARAGRERRRRRRSRRLTRRHPDIEVARLLVKRGFVSKSAAVGALRTQKTRARSGEARIPFLKVLVRAGVLAEERLPEVQDEIRAHTYICERCDARAVVLAGSQTRAGACPRCGHEISVEPPTGPGPDAVPPADFQAEESETQTWQPMRQGPDLRRGQTIFGRYVLHEELGRGAMGVVYRATNQHLGKDVALKVLLPTEEMREQQVARFRREAAAVQKLRHERIVPVHDFGYEGDIYYLTMDLIEGSDTLHRALKRREDPLTLRQRLSIMAQVAQAVAHAHERKVIHRDLKPANVLLDRSGQPLVVDFGLAKDEEAGEGELTRTHDRLGTPLFMAPEQIRRGAAQVDGRADVWALGVMLFACVTGRYPFRSRTVMDLYLRIMREPPDWTGTRYSAPDQAGYRPDDERDSELASGKQDPFASTNTLASDEATEVASRTGPEGQLPRTIVEAPEDRFAAPTPPPFVPPPELEGREVPKDLRLIVECALAKDPADRYASAEELAADVERFLEGLPVHARRPALLKRLRWGLNRKRVLIPLASGLAVAVVLLSALAAGFLVREARRQEREQVRREVATAWGHPQDERDYEAAWAAMSDLLGRYPDHPAVLLRRGVAAARLLRLDDAARDLELASAHTDQDALRQEVAAEQVLVAHLRGDRAGLAAAARDVLEGASLPSYGAALRAAQAAFVLEDGFLRGRVEEVLGTLRSRADAPRAVAAYHARLALERGEVATARQRLPEVADLEEELDYEVLLAHAAVHLGEGAPQRARPFLERARGRPVWFYRNLDDAVGYYDGLGYRRKLDRDAPAALLANRAAAFLAPFHPAPRYYSSRLHATFTLDRDALVAAAGEAMALDAWDVRSRDLLLATWTATREGFPEARAFLEREAELRPEDPEPYLRLAYLALREGDAPAGRRWIDAARGRAAGSKERLRLAEAACALLEGAEDHAVDTLEELYAPTDLPESDASRPWVGELERRNALDRVETAQVYLVAGYARRALALLAKVPDDRGTKQHAETRRWIGDRYLLEARALAALGEVEGVGERLTLALADQEPHPKLTGLREPMPPSLFPELLRAYPELQGVEAAAAAAAELEARRAAQTP